MRSFLGLTRSSSAEHDEQQHGTISMTRNKIFSAFFYGISSILVIFSNKAILTQYHFPYFKFVAFIQFVTTSLVLFFLSLWKKVDIPPLSKAIFIEIVPISLMFLGNVLCGLGSTKALSIPMFTALRRFSILMTMLGEWAYLSVRPSLEVVVSVGLMVGGAFIAALYDLSYDTAGYGLVFLNNVFTALNGVWMKKASISGKCSKMGVLYYNSLFSAVIMFLYFAGEHYYIGRSSGSHAAGAPNLRAIVPTADAITSAMMHWPEKVIHQVDSILPHQVAAQAADADSQEAAVRRLLGYFAVVDGEGSVAVGTQHKKRSLSPHSIPSDHSITHIQHTKNAPQSTLTLVYAFPDWLKWDFLVMLALACFMGSILNYSIFLCTTYNSALTTAVVGTLKNVLTTYIGMIAFSDYAFTIVNFTGINISIAGSLYYTYCTMMRKKVTTRSSGVALSDSYPNMDTKSSPVPRAR